MACKVNIGPVSFNAPTIGPKFHPVKEEEFQKGIANLEVALQWLGYLSPFLFGVPGKLREIGGVFEGGCGLGKAGYHFVKSQIATTEEEQKQETAQMWESLDYAKHGGANIVRGFVENIPLVNMVACGIWDVKGARMKYKAEMSAQAPAAELQPQSEVVAKRRKKTA